MLCEFLLALCCMLLPYQVTYMMRLCALKSPEFFFFYSYADHRDLHSFPTRRSSDLKQELLLLVYELNRSGLLAENEKIRFNRSEERFSRNAETDLVCRLLLEKKKAKRRTELCFRSIIVAGRVHNRRG